MADQLSEGPIKEIIKRVIAGEDFVLFRKEGLISDEYFNYCTCENNQDHSTCCMFTNPIKAISMAFSCELRQFIYNNCTEGLKIIDPILCDNLYSEIANVAPKRLIFANGNQVCYARFENSAIYPRFYLCEDYDYRINLSEVVMLATEILLGSAELPALKCVYTDYPAWNFKGVIIHKGRCNVDLPDYYIGMTPLAIYEKYFHNNGTKSARKI